MKKSTTTKVSTKAATKAVTKAATKDQSPSRLIDARIKELGDWRARCWLTSARSSGRLSQTWSKSGSGEAFPCGITAG